MCVTQITLSYFIFLYPKPYNTSYLDLFQSPKENMSREKKDCVMEPRLITLELSRGVKDVLLILGHQHSEER